MDTTPFLREFQQEAEDQLLILEQGLLQLEHLQDPEVVRRMFTAAHTIKGSAAMLGLQDIARVTHELEEVLDQLRKRPRVIRQAQASVLLQVLDEIRTLCDQVLDPQPRPEPLSLWMDRLKHWEQAHEAPPVFPAQADPAPQIDPVPPAISPSSPSPDPAAVSLEPALLEAVVYDVSMTTRMQQAWLLLEAGFRVRYARGLEDLRETSQQHLLVVGLDGSTELQDFLRELSHSEHLPVIVSHPAGEPLPDFVQQDPSMHGVPFSSPQDPFSSLLVQTALQESRGLS